MIVTDRTSCYNLAMVNEKKYADNLLLDFKIIIKSFSDGWHHFYSVKR